MYLPTRLPEICNSKLFLPAACLFTLLYTQACSQNSLAVARHEKISHANYYHTVLGLMEIDTTIHDPARDLIIHA